MKANTIANRVSLFQNVTAYWLDDATANDVAQLPTEKMYELKNEVEAEIKKHELRLAKLLDGVSLKFSADFVKGRKAKDGDFGLVRVERQGYVVEQTVPKRVSWDQGKLETIELQIEHQWGSDPKDYIETERKVQEKKYGAWPTEIKKLLEPARTTKPGKVKVEIKRKENAMKTEITIGEKYGPAMKITDQAKAHAYLEECVQNTIERCGVSRPKAQEIERSNLGYYAGYYDHETRIRIEKLFGGVHPIFGNTNAGPVSPEEAFFAGVKMATTHKEQS